MKHIFSSLLEVGFAGECRERNLVGEKVDFEDITLVHGVFKVALVTTVVFQGRTDVPTDLTVFAKWSARVGVDVSDDASAEWGEGGPIEVEVSEHGCVSGKRWVNARGPKKIQSDDGLR
jgi:hypothetical protein